METKASHVLIGAFVLAAFMLAIIFVLWLGKVSLDREWDQYDIVFNEAVSGLTVGGAVQFNGIQLGEVRKLSLAPDDPSRVIARVRIQGGTPVKTDTQARLAITGLTGVTVIQMSGGTRASAPLKASAKIPIPRIIAQTSALQKLLNSSEDIASSANEVLMRLSMVLNNKNIERVSATFANLEQISGSLSDSRTDLQTTFRNSAIATERMNATLKSIDAAAQRVNQFTAKADGLIDQEARSALVEARAALASARATSDSARAIMQDNRAAIDQFAGQALTQVSPALAELRLAIESLHALLERLENNPSELLRQEQLKEVRKP